MRQRVPVAPGSVAVGSGPVLRNSLPTFPETMLRLATKFAPKLASFETAHRAGFRCAELWTDTPVMEDWEAVLKLARYYPMEYVLHFPNRLDLTTRHLESAARLYAKLNCRCMVIHQPMHDKYRESLLAMVPAMKLAVENHHLNPEKFRDWAEKNEWLALDVEHFWALTLQNCARDKMLAGLKAIIATYGRKLRHVHLPGHVPGGEQHRPMYCNRDMVHAVFTQLAEAGFEGFVVSHADAAYQTPEDLRMDGLLFELWRSRQDPAMRDPTAHLSPDGAGSAVWMPAGGSGARPAVGT